MALAAKMDGKAHRIYCATSDGEHQAGSTWEAIMFAAKYKLDNLVMVCDRNYIQIDGNTEEIMPLGDMAAKYREFGWHAITVDGHDFEALKKAFAEARQTKGKPTAIIAITKPGKGVASIEGDYKWHGRPPKADEAEKMLAELQEERNKLEAME
jgi:transketolase